MSNRYHSSDLSIASLTFGLHISWNVKETQENRQQCEQVKDNVYIEPCLADRLTGLYIDEGVLRHRSANNRLGACLAKGMSTPNSLRTSVVYDRMISITALDWSNSIIA
ncbi:hypothetical protein BgiMline_026108 [Biomphalaria glabrata]|nr:hypothetical protein BgiMline_031305 [Biomphalaria glabrata]